MNPSGGDTRRRERCTTTVVNQCAPTRYEERAKNYSLNTISVSFVSLFGCLPPFHQEDLWGGDGRRGSPRFSLLIVDVGDAPPTASPCAVVLIPRGRDRDFMFSSREGLEQVTVPSSCGRVISEQFYALATQKNRMGSERITALNIAPHFPISQGSRTKINQDN